MRLYNIYWGIRKILNPKFVQARNNYIQSNINQLKRLKAVYGEENFNKRFGPNYINKMEKDLV